MINMKKSIIILCLFLLGASCSEEEIIDTDNIQEFIYLTETTFNANEGSNNTVENAIEINAEMLTFEPRPTDVVLSLEIIENGAVAGVDYELVSSSQIITIPAGQYSSTEGFKIKTIDNNISSSEERQLIVRLSAVDDSALNLGLGISTVTNLEAIISIADDECPDTIDKFNGATWSFTGVNPESGEYEGNFSTTLSGNTITISGDLAAYDVGITVDAVLTPEVQGATSGTVTFEPSSIGNDGSYDYRWVLKEPGTYDVCAGTMELVTTLQYIDIFGPDPTAWVDWYDSEISAKIESEGSGGGGSCFLSPFDATTADVSSSLTDFNSEYFYDDYDAEFTGVSISINEDCSVLTVTGDFIDLGASLSDIGITFVVTPDDTDANIGTLALATQVLGSDDGGFEYRVSSTGVPGTFNIADGSINVELNIDYNNNGAGYTNWYKCTSSFTIN